MMKETNKPNLELIIKDGYEVSGNGDFNEWTIYINKDTADVCLYNPNNDKVIAHKSFNSKGERYKWH